MRILLFLIALTWLSLPAWADWPSTGNVRLDDLLSKAKGAPHPVAMKMYDEATNIDSQCSDIFSERAIHFQQDRQFEKAIQDCDKALALKPTDALAYLTKGRVYLELGRYKDAIASVSKASELSDGGSYDLGNDELRVWGAALYHLGQYEEALVPLTSGMTSPPSQRKNADVLYYRGLCYEKLRQNHKALKDLDVAIKLESNRPQYYFARARILKHAGKVTLATADERRAKSLPKETHNLFR